MSTLRSAPALRKASGGGSEDGCFLWRKDALLMKKIKDKGKSSAVRIAIDEYLRKKKVEKIKSMRGKLEFDLTATEIRHNFTLEH